MTRRCKLQGWRAGGGCCCWLPSSPRCSSGAAPIAEAAEQVQPSQFAEGEHYVLPAGETVADDLYVSAGDVTMTARWTAI